MRVTLFTLLAVQSALAFPMVRRQSEVLSTITAVVSSAVSVPSMASSVATSAASRASGESLSAVSVRTSEISSVQASGSAMPSSAMSAMSSAASAAPSYFKGEYAFPCPAGTDLFYVQTQSNYDGPLADLIAAVGNFGNSSLFQISNVTGSNNTVGQTRDVSINGTMANEILTNYTVNAATNAVYLTWNATREVMYEGLTIGAYSTEEQVYINDTLTSATAPVSTVKIFSNICASNKTAASPVFLAFFEDAIRNGTMAAARVMESGSMSMSMMPSASSVVSSAASSASSAIRSEASSAIGGILPTSAASSLASQVSSATSMVSSAASSAASSSVTSVGQQITGGALRVQTPPSLVQCQPASIVFGGGSAPYFLSILPGGEPTATPLEQFAEQSVAGSYVWNVNIASGTSVTLSVRDGTGAINYSSPVTIQSGTDSSCLVSPTSSA